MTSLRRALGALPVVVLLVVGGCSGDPSPPSAEPTSGVPSSPPPTSPVEPVTSSPPGTSSTPSATASPEPDPLTPEETVRAWIAARNTLLRTGRRTAVDALSTPACTTCRGLNKGIAEVYEAGGYIRTKGWVVNGAKRLDDFSQNRTVATALVFSRGVRRESSNSGPRSYPEERNFLDFTLSKVDSRWLVNEVVFVA